jgi:hypothetical protein
MEDMRASERFNAGLGVQLRWQANGTEVSATGVADDISDGGAALSIKLSPMPPVGAEISLQVVRSGDGEAPILTARVVRHTAAGLAVCFIF